MARILVIDDHPTNRDFIGTLLRYSQHDVVEASDGAEALELALQTAFDLVISDILMPTMDGFELVRRLRDTPSTATLPVIFYSATYFRREAEALARSGGVASILYKPAEPEKILSEVARVLGAAPGERAPVPAVYPDQHRQLISDKLFRTTQRLDLTSQRLAALLESVRDFTRMTDIRSLADSVARWARELIGARRAFVLFQDNDQRDHFFVGATGFLDPGSLSADRWPATGPLAELVAGSALVRVDAIPPGDRAGLPAWHQDVANLLAVRIMSGDELSGILCCTDKLGGDPFTEEDEYVTLALVAQTGALLERLRFAGESEGRARQQQVVARLGLKALAASDLDALFREATDEVAATLGVPFARLLECRAGGKLVVRAATGWPEDFVGRSYDECGPGTYAERVMRSLGPVVFEDLASAGVPLGEMLEGTGAVTGVSVSIGLGSPDPASSTENQRPLKIFGALCVFSTTRRRFTPGDCSFLQSLANLLGTAIRHRSLEHQFRHSQKMEAVGRLAGGVAHDFNNLLTVISGYAKIIEEDSDEGARHVEHVREIQDAAKRAADLTRQLLAFSRRQVLEPTVIEANEVIGLLDRLIRRVLGEYIQFRSVLTPDAGRIRVDPSQLEQVLLNLVINARDAMPAGGKLTVETLPVEIGDVEAGRHEGLRPGRYVMLAVTDTGIGMPPEVRARVFEPFFTTKAKGVGTGLGLSTVYGIVQQSGGAIAVYSEPGRGTTFKIFFPRTDEHAPVAVPRADILIRGGDETVLVVEDDPAVRNYATSVLQRAGYRVLAAAGPQEALDLGRQHGTGIAAVLSDVVMPRMSGPRLVAELTTLCPGLRVLYMSGYTENAIVHQGELDPGVAYLRKPFAPEALTARIREVLDTPSQRPRPDTDAPEAA